MFLPPADADAFGVCRPAVPLPGGAQIPGMEKNKSPTEKPAAQKPAAPVTRPRDPSPSERHPGRKPEDAEGSVEDLEIRETGNRR